MERPRIMGAGGGRDCLVISGDCEIDNLIFSQPDASCVAWIQDGAPKLYRLLFESRGEPPEDRNGAAIYVGGAAEPEAYKVSIGPCCSSGIFFANFSAGRWSNIRIQRSGGAGVYLAHDSAPSIEGLHISYPNAAAVVATNTSKGAFTDIDITRSNLPAMART